MDRICIVRRDYYPASAHVRKDADTLTRAGYEVDVIALRNKDQKRFEILDGIRVYRLPIMHKRGGLLRYLLEYGAFTLISFMVLSYLAFRRRYKVVEVDTIPDFLVFAAVVPKLMGARVLLYLIEMTPDLFQFVYGIGPRHPLIKFLRFAEVMSARFADSCLTCSESFRKTYGDHGIPVSKITVIPNVPDEARFLPEDYVTPARDPQQPFTIMSHGTILERYGIQTLLKATPRLLEEITDLRILLMGRGEYQKDLEKLADELDISDKVVFPGFVPYIDMVNAIATADLGYVGITFPYMSPNKIFEFAAMGTPTVSTSIHSITDWFTTNNLTFFTPEDHEELAERILELYREPKRRKELGIRLREHYRSYCWDVSSHTYLDIHSRLISHKSAKRPPRDSAVVSTTSESD